MRDSFRKNSAKLDNEDAIVYLIKFTDKAKNDILRATNNNEKITVGGHDFTPVPLEIIIPARSDKTASNGTIRMSNLGIEIVDLIRKASSDVDVLVQTVEASQPQSPIQEYDWSVKETIITNENIDITLKDIADIDEPLQETWDKHSAVGYG